MQTGSLLCEILCANEIDEMPEGRTSSISAVELNSGAWNLLFVLDDIVVARDAHQLQEFEVRADSAPASSAL